MLAGVAAGRLCFVPGFPERVFEDPFRRVFARDLVYQEDVFGFFRNVTFELATQARWHDHCMEAIAFQYIVLLTLVEL